MRLFIALVVVFLFLSLFDMNTNIFHCSNINVFGS